MARYDYDWNCNGCGSGTSCSFRIARDGIRINEGTVQVPCGTDQLTRIISFGGYDMNDVAFSNGVQFYPDPSSSSIIPIIAIGVTIAYLALKEMK